MKKCKTKIIVLTVIFVAVAISLAASKPLLRYYHKTNTQMYCLLFMKEMLLDYIEMNNGSFPDSEDDLIEAGVLKYQQKKYYRISKTPYQEDDCYELWWYKDFKIKYGIKSNDYELRNQKLYFKSQSNGDEVLFIEGPKTLILKLQYRYMTVELFQKMEMEKQNKSENI